MSVIFLHKDWIIKAVQAFSNIKTGSIQSLASTKMVSLFMQESVVTVILYWSFKGEPLVTVILYRDF
jgi:hypothetical protein